MRILPQVSPTPEQLKILLKSSPGVFLVRGAAGSGKTTTALLRLTQLCGLWLSRKQRLRLAAPVRVLVLTYNKTLEGYIYELAKAQVAGNDVLAAAGKDGDLLLEVSTFGKWSVGMLPSGQPPEISECRDLLDKFAGSFDLPERFVNDEVDYVLGRFPVDDLESYLTCKREGRGLSPRMETDMRQRLLNEVIDPYLAEKKALGLRDWHDVTANAYVVEEGLWDVVIVDEAQDFSANQVRALMRHVPENHSVTFVMDAAQRIYPRSFTWKEAGITIESSERLKHNYRNTTEIAAFARSILEGMSVGDDGTLPNFANATGAGPKPRLLVGLYSSQVDWSIQHVVKAANLGNESVAFLHPLGGGWFKFLKNRLNAEGFRYAELTRASTWPSGDETVALSTIHSAKGLEFDHVVVLGLNQEVTPHGEGEGDTQLEVLRRLMAMGVGRARKTVTLGFKSGEESKIVALLNPETFERIELP